MFKRNHSVQLSSPCGLAFDDRNGQIIIAEYASRGGFDIYKAVIGERRAVNVLSTDLRTTLTRGNAHTDALPLAISADASEETILKAILEKTNGDRTHLLNFTRTPDYRIIATQVDASAVDQIVHRREKWLEEQQPEHIKTQEIKLSRRNQDPSNHPPLARHPARHAYGDRTRSRPQRKRLHNRIVV